jgi:general secretion pathway protein E/type IV pilus assembly protein PilB
MDKQRIGEVLGKMGQLSPHDIDEILTEQRATRQRFGTVAVSLGFCQPEHIWAAWCDQLNGRVELVDLATVGIDAQAIDCLPREIALGLRALPIRVWEGQLVVAVSAESVAGAVAELGRRVGMVVKCVMTTEEQLGRALETYYPAPQAA